VLLSALLIAHLDYGAAHKARPGLCSTLAVGRARARVTARAARGRALCEQRRAPLDWARRQAGSFHSPVLAGSRAQAGRRPARVCSSARRPPPLRRRPPTAQMLRDSGLQEPAPGGGGAARRRAAPRAPLPPPPPPPAMLESVAPLAAPAPLAKRPPAAGGAGRWRAPAYQQTPAAAECSRVKQQIYLVPPPVQPCLAGACTRWPTARPLALLRAPAAGSPAAGRLHAGRGGPVGLSDSGRRIGVPRLWDGRARLMGGLAAGGAQEEMAASGADAAGAAYRERVAQASEAFTARDFATASALKAEARAGRAWAGRFGLNMRGHAEVGLLGFVGACGARGSPRRRGRFPRSRAPRRALRRPAALALMSWRARHAGARLPRPGVAAGQGGAAPNQAAHVRRPPACAPRRAAGRCTRVCSVCLARLCTGSHHHQKAMRRRRRLMQRRFVCGAAA